MKNILENENMDNNITADIIIVGGGSAGAVLAARLSENPSRNVILIEAGAEFSAWGYPHDISSSDALGGNGNSELEWGYVSEAGFINNPIRTLRGKVLGGSSGVNGAVAIRSRPKDFENWDLNGWGYEDMLPFFKRLENRFMEDLDTNLHGTSGPLPIRQLSLNEITPMQRAFVDSTQQIGFSYIENFDSANANGVGPYPMNITNGVRINTGIAYLTNQVRKRHNLIIMGECEVDHVLFDDDKAKGVILTDGRELYANKVILSAGSYGSAAILLRSGIGPADDLKNLDIPVVSDLPVGKNLKDHPFYYNAYAAIPEKISKQSPVIGAKLWTRSSDAQRDELDIHITATHLFPHDMSPTGVGFVLAVALTRPKSIGKLTLASRDPKQPPVIDLNFLAHEDDRHRLLEGIRLAQKIGRLEPLSTLIDSEINPPSTLDSDSALLDSVMSTLDTYHHPTSTAPMGGDDCPKSVVDLEAKVKGVKNLMVVDASIFPDIPSVATNITTIAVAEKIAANLMAK